MALATLPLGTYAGIPIKLHWTFGFLILLVGWSGYSNGFRGTELLWFGSYVLLLFFCVILHEYGHALTARRYNIATKDIIISPIGGVARLEKLPDEPKHEVLVAIAGPLVNLVIFVLIQAVVLIVQGDSFTWFPPSEIDAVSNPISFAQLVAWMNLILFVFNLVPAFPMDGGRILRALLSMQLGKVKATRYAAIVGRVMAVGFLGAAYFFDAYILGFIAVFVFLMAGLEDKQVETEHALEGATANDLYNQNYGKLHLSSSLQTAFNFYIRGGARSYVVFDSLGNVSGVIPELFLQDAYHNPESFSVASDLMSDSFLVEGPEISLKELFNKMNYNGIAVALIKKDDQLLGVVDRPLIQSFIRLRTYRP